MKFGRAPTTDITCGMPGRISASVRPRRSVFRPFRVFRLASRYLAAMPSIVSNTISDFRQRIATREARIGIVGLGYAGLPLALGFAEAGFDVTGIDLNAERVAAVRERRSYLVDV